MQHCTMDQKVRNVLFEPYLSPKPGTREGRTKDISGEVHLGLIVEQLTSTTALLHNELPHADSLIKKSAMISDMTAAELKKVFKLKINIILRDNKIIQTLFSNNCIYYFFSICLMKKQN